MKNESFVANRVDIDTAWIFKTVSDAEPAANVEEAVALVDDLLASFDGFVYPAFPEGDGSAVKQWLSGVSEWTDRI